jgi:hypothetical protein
MVTATDGKTPWKILEVVMSIMLALLTVMGAAGLRIGWGIKEEQVDQGERISAIEANRFTTKDALDVTTAAAASREAIWSEIASIKEALGHKANTEDVPPPQVVRELERLQREIEKLRNGD